MRYAARCEARRRELDAALQRFVAFCGTLPDVRAAYVFGSYSAGKVGPSSDLDLLIVREKDGSRAERVAEFYTAAANIGVGFDAIAVLPDEYARRLPQTSFGRTILATAKQVYAA